MLQKHTLKYYGVEEHDAGDILSNRSEKSNCESESKTKQMWQTVNSGNPGRGYVGVLCIPSVTSLHVCKEVQSKKLKQS